MPLHGCICQKPDIKVIFLPFSREKPAADIIRFATEKGIDLIIIGTQGKRGLERLLLGSVAEQVIRLAPCKVLVVK